MAATDFDIFIVNLNRPPEKQSTKAGREEVKLMIICLPKATGPIESILLKITFENLKLLAQEA